MNVLKDGETVINHLEDKSNISTNNLEDNLIDILTAEIEPIIDFEVEDFEQIQTKGGIRWIKKWAKK